MDRLLQDIRYGVRMLVKNPGFTLIALIALALGIGGTTAIFSVVNSVLLKPLPYAAADRIYALYAIDRQRGGDYPVSPANFVDVTAQQHVFSAIGAYRMASANLSLGGRPERITTAQASASMFQVLQLRPVAGHMFGAENEQLGHEHVVVLGYKLWQRLYAGAGSAIGQTLRLNSEPYTIIGVAPPTPLLDFDCWIPSPWGGVPEHPLLPGKDPRTLRGRDYFDTMGRLASGVTAEQAGAELATIARRLEQQYPDDNKDLGFRLYSLRDDQVGDLRPTLALLFAAIAAVLLIACANVANLLLARAAARQKEISVRTALGASRLRIMRQLLTESVLLSLMAGALGVLLAVWLTPALLAMSPPDLRQLGAAGLDYRVLLFALGISVLTGLAFGVAPGVRVARLDLHNSLKEGARTTQESVGSRRTRAVLIAAEMAVSLLLLAAAGLLLRSFTRVMQVDPGFDSHQVAIFTISPPTTLGKDRQIAMFQQVEERLRAIPGVTQVGAVNRLPLSPGNSSRSIQIPGRTEKISVDLRVSTPGYFRAVGIPLLGGRDFTDADKAEAPAVAVINQELVRRYFKGEDVLGRTFTIGDTPIRIVGVIGNEHYISLDSPLRPEAYLPLPQSFWNTMSYAVRSANPDAMALSSSLEKAVWSVDAELPLVGLQPMEQLVAHSVLRRRFTITLLAMFAGVALLLAAVGLYGVMSYIVSQRTREFGLRMALGAQPADVLRMVVGQGMRLTLIGIGCGLAAALGLSRLLTNLLFGVKATDPATFLAIGLLLSAIALLSTYVPARRATRVDPMVALRDE